MRPKEQSPDNSNQPRYLCDLYGSSTRAFKKYGVRLLALGKQATTLEGDFWRRHAVIEFDSIEAAHACHNSP